MELSTIASLTPASYNKTIDVRLYRKWTAKSLPHLTPIVFCCILIDQEHNGIQANMNLKDIDYFNRILSVSGITHFKDPNRSEKTLRKIDIENLNGNIVELTLWDEMAEHFGQAKLETMEQPVIIAVSSCRVSKYRDYQLTATPATFYYLNPKIPEAETSHDLEHERMILKSVENGPLIWSTVEENGVTRTKKYAELSAAEKIQDDYDMKATNIILQGLAVPVFSPGDDPIAYLNKAMAFLTTVASSRFPSTNNQLRTSSNLRNKATIQDERSQCNKFRGDKAKVILVLVIRVMLLVLGETMQVNRQGLLNATTVKTEDLDTYDSNCDDISNAKAVLMAIFPTMVMTLSQSQEGNGSFGFQDLCLRQEPLEYIDVHDNDASESSQSGGKCIHPGLS
nr:hypothetical protein [Tanacetum cinerariifolium]